MHEALEGLSGTKVIVDDILVYGKGNNIEEAVLDHDSNVKKLFERLLERGIKLNPSKVQYKQK